MKRLVFLFCFLPSFLAAQMPVHDRAPVQILKSDLDTSVNTLHIAVFDAVSGNPLRAEITVFGLEYDKEKTWSDTSSLTLHTDQGQIIRFEINAAGYMPFNDHFTSSSKDTTVMLKAQLQKARSGSSVSYATIRFTENSARLLPSSKAPIMAMARFLRANPGAVIEIGGHINSPGTKNTSAMKKLSKARAEAVRDELLTYGIEKKRMKVKGYGNSRMIYKDARFPHEEEMNRRVEMTVLQI